MGRFTQIDPIGFGGGLNLYGYANGDPVNFRDPSGLSAEDGACVENGVALSVLECEAAFDLLPDDLNPCEERWWSFACQMARVVAASIGGTVGFGLGGGVGAIASAPTGGAVAPATVPASAVIGAGLGATTAVALFDLVMFSSSQSGTTGRQLRRLSNGEIRAMKETGHNPHSYKENSTFDLYKNRNGEIFVGRKDGGGQMDPLGLNIYKILKIFGGR